MKILNFGSLNVDKVYRVEHFVSPGETISSLQYNMFCGGKGLNQSIAVAKAGAKVYHAGKIGHDGEMLLEKLKAANVDTQFVKYSNVPSGHAIIQVDKTGQNSIILYGGANQDITPSDVDEVLKNFTQGDILVLQNEISSLEYILKKAAQKGMIIVLNPSPIDEIILQMNLSMVDYFLLNEIEGKALTGKTDPGDICANLLQKYKSCKIVLTLGSNGVFYRDPVETKTHGVYAVDIIDTTAAGDTFTGYFIACLTEGLPIELALEKASKASALTIGKPGAADSIPIRAEVDQTTIQQG